MAYLSTLAAASAVLWEPLVKGASYVAGRTARHWWLKLDPEVRRRRRGTVTSALAVGLAAEAVTGCVLFNQLSTRNPVTGRRQLIFPSGSVAADVVGPFFRDLILKVMRDHLLPRYHPETIRANFVLQEVISANGFLPGVADVPWRVHVVKDIADDFPAFALVTGDVFISANLFNTCEGSADRVALVVAHEVAHVALRHGEEVSGRKQLEAAASSAPWVAVAAAVPRPIWAFMACLAADLACRVAFSLPLDREIEREADRVGLFMCALTCVDLQEGLNLWESLEDILGKRGRVLVIGGEEVLSSHPSLAERLDLVESALVLAEEQKRRACGGKQNFAERFAKVCGRIPEQA